MKKKIEEWEKMFRHKGGKGIEIYGDDYWNPLTLPRIKSFIRSLLLSQHTQDMKAFKKAIPEKLTDATTTWGEVGNAGWNACRQEVLTKIEKM
jgi:uncharacterized Fe-S cluster-containing radical SAM superfamily enzyme